MLPVTKNLPRLAQIIAPPSERIAYVRHMAECRGISPRHMHRAFWLASRVLRTDYETAKAIVRCAWLGRPDIHLDKIGPLDDRVIGRVYYAKCESMPGLVKIGFTTDIERRRQQLARIHGGEVSIIVSFTGTMLEEHAAHCIHRRHRVVGEWFRPEAAAHHVTLPIEAQP